MAKRTAVIIGAGPAGLTAAFELCEQTNIVPIVLEMSDAMGGIARTVNYKGNRIDIGGHRFFSKSQKVMNWWFARMPMERVDSGSAEIAYQGKRTTVENEGVDPETTDRVMLLRSRKSRIYYLRQFFDYPIKFNSSILRKLGARRSVKIGLSYAKAAAMPIKRPKNLEEFFINRFGRELYRTFFKSYTEKVWGVACNEISAEWGAQRIKGLSITKAVKHFFKKRLGSISGGIAQKGTETSLIEQFLYPKYGPGQMWETVAEEVQARGGTILTGQKVTEVLVDKKGRIQSVKALDQLSGLTNTHEGDFFFSTMPVPALVQALDVEVPSNVQEVSDGLMFRDFITVGLLVEKLKVRDENEPARKLIRDNWIYVQEPDVVVGRLQLFNNWSDYMVSDPTKVWIGLEYFCSQGDAIWEKTDEELKKFGADELHKIEVLDKIDVLDATVVRMPKTYPAYFGTYDRFSDLSDWTDNFENLFLIGRNGMHRYNNQDHSMLTAMQAVENIRKGVTDKSNIWGMNVDQEYHEEKQAPSLNGR